MAGRIRSIKPEILDDEKCASLSHLEFRIFVGSWLIADDYGNLRGDPDYVRGQVVWASRESRETVAKALETLANVSLLVPYRVRGQSYLHIAGWAKHQKVDKPGKPRMPGISESDQPDEVVSRESREVPSKVIEVPATDLRPPTSDPEPGDPSRAIPPSTPPPPTVVSDELQLRQAARAMIWREFGAIRTEVAAELGISAQPLPAIGDPGERALAIRLSEAGPGGIQGVITAARHAMAVAAAEARRADVRSVQWLTGALFEDRSWRRAIGMTVEDAKRKRAGPYEPRPDPTKLRFMTAPDD